MIYAVEGLELTVLELQVEVLSVSSVSEKDSSHHHHHYQCHRQHTGGYSDGDNPSSVRFVHCLTDRVGHLLLFSFICGV
jgi:hypothetical protein